jgi:cysteine desulfurase / selenocysteine lyase
LEAILNSRHFDIERARRETIGTNLQIHFNNAGASLMPEPVHSAVINHINLEARIGGYEAADAAKAQLDVLYVSIAKLINAHPDEVAFVENATRAWDRAFYAIPFKTGDRILTSKSEYASNVIAFLQVAQTRGSSVEIIPDDQHGQVDVAALETLIDDRVKLIAITHVPTQGGLVNPVAGIGAVARKHAVPFLLDACKSIGQMPIDVEAIGCDMLSATGRKFLRGPRGTGFLYVRKALIEQLEPPFLDLHAATWTSVNSYTIRQDAKRFENWESYVAGRLGLAVAVDYALEWGLEAIAQRNSHLASLLREGLSNVPGCKVQDLGAKKCAIVTFTKNGLNAADIKARLTAEKINTSVSSLAYARLDFEARGLTSIVRASPHYYNTEDEIAQFLDVIRRL